MADQILTSTLQSAVLSATSNILAQVISAYQDEKPFSINFTPILQFIFMNLLITPPNILWQQWLEDHFPASPPPAKAEKQNQTPSQLNLRNTLTKFLLDQTFGAVGNTLLFLALASFVKGNGLNATIADVQANFSDIILAGYKFWPLVSIVSFAAVPLRNRVLFGSSAGLLWNIYLSLKAR